MEAADRKAAKLAAATRDVRQDGHEQQTNGGSCDRDHYSLYVLRCERPEGVAKRFNREGRAHRAAFPECALTGGIFCRSTVFEQLSSQYRRAGVAGQRRK